MGSNVGDSDGVGIVIGRLMKIADVMGLGASSISMIENINSNVERELIEKYFDQVLSEKGLQKPSIHTLSVPSIALQEVESDAHKTENFEYYLLDDPKVHGKSKMKKAFCMPENITFCPPIVLANIFGPSEIVINRSEENGGNITYSNQFDMEDDFKSGSLHPGDLKATATTIMVEVLEKLSGSMKQDKSVSQAIKALKAFEKKMSKKKK
jgi:tyrosyl-tRNA synthetase